MKINQDKPPLPPPKKSNNKMNLSTTPIEEILKEWMVEFCLHVLADYRKKILAKAKFLKLFHKIVK
jgi:hypothetical protein